ncbi:MAG: DNA-protecting protein DprA [Anaerolineae bacterium]|nr:DNA-protecting protein DprA [Anaerolineae bacterium]
MRQYWLAFARVQGIGPNRLRQLHDAFGSLEAAWHAPRNALQAVGLPPQALNHHALLKRNLAPEQLLEQLEALGAWALTWEDADYPALLRQTEGAPALLYGKGHLLPQDQSALAVVGTRRASTYGKLMTERLVTELTLQGISIVSGLAHGIDISAHRAALAAGGRTLAVLGTGIDVIYPPEHRQDAQAIAEAGALLTEYPPGTKPERHNFPARNRIISGLALGVLVVEAPQGSGALQTTRYAAEQGRDVFAVPGNVTSPNSYETNRLIQDGAKLVLAAEDILCEFNLAQRNLETRQTLQAVVPDSPAEGLILEKLSLEAWHVDELSRLCQLSIQETNATLALLELKGLVIQTAPMTYERT